MKPSWFNFDKFDKDAFKEFILHVEGNFEMYSPTEKEIFVFGLTIGIGFLSAVVEKQHPEIYPAFDKVISKLCERLPELVNQDGWGLRLIATHIHNILESFGLSEEWGIEDEI